MTRKGFGETWWGRAWIAALNQIDDSNRLPRGRNYANQGAVTETNVKNGVVLARVQGRRKSPYKIKIKLQPYSVEEMASIKYLIAENPVLAAELSLGKLPENLLAAMQAKGIGLLPTSWREINANCSCPDWANPCKHLAAVYYILANEIDKNPFILFSLKGMERDDLMGAAGFAMLEKLDERFVPLGDVSVGELDDLEFSPSGLAGKASEYRALFSLLSDSALFYKDGNFKKLLMKAYKNVAGAVKRQKLEEPCLDLRDAKIRLIYKDDQHPLLASEFFVFPGKILGNGIADREETLSIPVAENSALTMKRVRGEVISTSFLFLLLLERPLVLEGTPDVRFLSAAASTALLLARTSAYVPDVVAHGTGNFNVSYRPLVRDKHVRSVIDDLAKMIPPGFVFRKKNKSVLVGRDGVEEVLSLYLTYLVGEYCDIPETDKLCLTFFSMNTYQAEKFEERLTAKAAADWLTPLSISIGRYLPVVRVELPTGRQKKLRVYLDVEDTDYPLAAPMPLSDVFGAGVAFSRPASELLAQVGRQMAVAGGYCPKLKELLAEKGQPLAMTANELMLFLGDARETLALLGVKVILPKEVRTAASAKLVLSAKSRSKNVSFLSLGEMVDFSWEVALGDLRLSRDEFMELVSGAEGIVHFRDRYLLLDPTEVNRLLAQLQKPAPKISAAQVLRAGLTGEAGDVSFEGDDILMNLLSDLHVERDVVVPRGLVANLRPYQERGFRWLYANREKGLGSCLADDMGLGKTLQVIALILKLKEEGTLTMPALIVCPTTLLGNWEKECARFAPSLRVAVCHGSDRELLLDRYDVILTTYGVIRNDKEIFARHRWSLLAIDEAQNIKNADTGQAIALKTLQADGFVAMSGTPVENRLDELWSIFNFILPGFLGSRQGFSRRFALPIEKYRDLERVAVLRKATAPFVMRRMKTDKTVIDDLPDKIAKNEYCRLTAQQAALYREVLDREIANIEKSDGMSRRGLILKLMTSLKQICNHPVHFAKKGHPRPAQSGKAQMALALLDNILRSGEKALVFTQYREMGELLVMMIKEQLDYTVPFFHGGLQRKAREKMVETFQDDTESPLMVVSLRAGGTGLNLTAASHVLHYDLWWNPAVEDQATDRAYRIGQKKNVTVHRLVTLGTLEEKIDAMLTSKKELANLTLSTGETWLTEMSNQELQEIFSLSTTKTV